MLRAREGLRELQDRRLGSLTQNWNLIKVFYSIEINRIEFIYVVCESIEAAKRIMSPNDRAWFTQKLKRHLVKITALSNDIMTAHENFTEPYEKVENVAVIIKPPGNLEVIEELQDGPNLLMQVQQLIKMITLLDDNQFIIRPDTNPITREPDYSQMYVFLPDKSYVKKLYDSQPFFGCLLVHKLTHPCLCPFVKYSKDVCIISDSEKSPGCIRDMNHDACARQVKVNIPCPASAQLIQKLAAKRKGKLPCYSLEAVAKYGESKICIKCENFRVAGCNTGLCSTCYAVQARREESPIQNESYYWKELKNMYARA